MGDLYRLYLSALKSYSEKLRVLSYDKNIELLKNDLVNEAVDAERLYREMNISHSLHDQELGKDYDKVEQNRKILCNALKYYSKNLKDSIDSIQKSLGINDIASEETKNQIKNTDKQYEDLCDKSKLKEGMK